VVIETQTCLGVNSFAPFQNWSPVDGETKGDTHSFARNETLGKGRHERTDDGEEHTDTDKDTIIPANNA